MTDLADRNIDELLEDFEFLEDWEDRYGYIIELGKKLPPMDEADKNEATRVHGCQSQVWMMADTRGGAASAEGGAGGGGEPRLKLTADSDAFIVRGLIAVLFVMYDGKPIASVSGIDSEAVFEQLGLDQHLSPTRRNGLFAMVKRIRELAALKG